MDKIETIHDRISQLVQVYGSGKNTVFATLIGENEANIRGYRSNIVPKYPLLEKIVKTLDISSDWLLTGRGDMVKQVESIAVHSIEERLLSIIQEKDAKIEELSRMVGRLEEKVEGLEKKTINTTGVEGAICADAAG